MFEKSKKEDGVFGGPKNVMFGHESDEEQQSSFELADINSVLAGIDQDIKTAKNNEKNSSIKMVYSSVSTQETTKPSSSCGCL